MTAYREAAFLAELLTGCAVGFRGGDGSAGVILRMADYEERYAEAAQLNEIARRLRRQARHTAASLRAWRRRHERLRKPVPRKYSTLDGMLLRQDLRQRWMLYREAMHELHETRRRCDAFVDRILADR